MVLRDTERLSECTNVLLIDDDVALCRMLQGYLDRRGWKSAVAHRASAGLAAALDMKTGVIILDVMLPDFDGFELLRRLRAQTDDLYVLLLTARGEELDRIIGLELGADDYVPKPFNPRELVARMHAVIRRGARFSQIRAEKFSIAGFTVDPASRSICFSEQMLDLTDLEFDLLHMLLSRPFEILNRSDLIENVFKRPFRPTDRSLDMHVLRLRRKLEKLRSFQGEIRTIRSNGYMLILQH